jgi:hypothetical protein
VDLISRRVEQHLERDWLLGFTMSNVLFQSLLNQCRAVCSHAKVRRRDNSLGFAAEELEAGAFSFCKALGGEYKDLDDSKKKVNGDLARVKYSTAFIDAGRRLLRNLEHSSRQLQGAMEVRKMMRLDTRARRIRRGVPILVTWSPDEKHNVLMIIMHRPSASDPIHTLGPKLKKFGERLQPSMSEDYVTMAIPAADVGKWLSNYGDRRAILARNGLASADGFRTGILLVRISWGLRVCPMCPDCNRRDADDGCQDLFGSNSFAEGGIVGRGNGVYISIEARKFAGSLRGHFQLQVQCVNQSKPLSDVVAVIAGCKARVVGEYLKYEEHLSRQVCEIVSSWQQGSRIAREDAWPEYSKSPELVSKPLDWTSDVEPEKWTGVCLAERVRRVQEMKQHHVLTLNQTGERVPLLHCRRPDNPTQCEGDFPRTMWLIDSAVVLRQGIDQQFGMSLGGRRSKLGSFHGPRNEENLNSAHPAMCAALQSNSDVQLLYRFALDTYAHADGKCRENCVSKASCEEVLEACQNAQDARAGYACDYQNKHAAKSCNEFEECVEGNRKLHAPISCNRPAYIGKRHDSLACRRLR